MIQSFLISYSKNSSNFIIKRKINHYFKIYSISRVKFQVVFQFLFTVFLDLPLHAVFSFRHAANFCICHLVSKTRFLIIFKAFCLFSCHTNAWYIWKLLRGDRFRAFI